MANERIVGFERTIARDRVRSANPKTHRICKRILVAGACSYLKLRYSPVAYNVLKQMALAARSGLFRGAA